LNKLLPLIVFSVLLLIPVGAQDAFAVPIESNGSGGGDWNDGSTWAGGVVPSSTDDVTIKSGDIVSLIDNRTIDAVGSLSIEAGAKLIIQGVRLSNSGSITNEGTITINGGDDIFEGSLTNNGTLINNGVIDVNGGTDFFTGNISNFGILINNGIMNFIGGSGASNAGIFRNFNIVSNNGEINLLAGRFFRSGSLFNFGGTTFTNECSGVINVAFRARIQQSGTSFFINFGIFNNSGTFVGGQFIDRTDECGEVTLIKIVEGGPADENDFMLSINGTKINSGQSIKVRINTDFFIDETQIDEYNFKDISGDDECPLDLETSMMLIDPTSVTCIITNIFQVKVIGGELLQIDTSPLLLASAQSTTWMIPVVISAIGIGLFVASRKS